MKTYSNIIDQCAVIIIEDGIVHLTHSFNTDASACQEDETGTLVQLEWYGRQGWYEPKGNPALATDFWGVWTDWNGRVTGGIYLRDDYTYDDADAELKAHPEHTPDEIANLPDGTYTIVAPIK